MADRHPEHRDDRNPSNEEEIVNTPEADDEFEDIDETDEDSDEQDLEA